VIDSAPIATIGNVDGDASQIFNRIAGVRLFSDGRIAVADGGSSTIRIYAADGQFQLQMGQAGDGPGEFSYISGIWIADPDTIVVYDSDASRMTRFLASGQLLETRTFRASDGIPEIYLGPLDQGGHALGWLKGARINPSVVVTDTVRFGRFLEDTLESVWATTSGMTRQGSPIPFSPHFVAARLGDTVFHSNGLQGQVHATGPNGQVVRSIQVPIDPWSVEEALARAGEKLDDARVRQMRDVTEGTGIDVVPTISEILAGEDRRLWIKQYDPATDSHAISRPLTGGDWLVIETDGHVVARVTIPEQLRLMEIAVDRIAGVMRDDLDVEHVVIYALRRT
jgi:hypothetical protein